MKTQKDDIRAYFTKKFVASNKYNIYKVVVSMPNQC